MMAGCVVAGGWAEGAWWLGVCGLVAGWVEGVWWLVGGRKGHGGSVCVCVCVCVLVGGG